MNRIHVLDCTLRDGGYCNQWMFGAHNIRKIINGLSYAGIDIIECGFLTEKVTYQKDVSRFTNLSQLQEFLPEKRDGRLFVAMMNYGDYDVEKLPDNEGNSIDGIRVAFHKKDLSDALKICRKIKEKGYKVFIQAMVSTSYTDGEFLAMIRQVNQLLPYAFYIVDSFGMMKKKTLLRLFYMVEHNLESDIWIGFHSHNNMQMAYANAQNLAELPVSRNLIIDTSVYGMGRGAGNLNTELFVEYLNETAGTNYDMKPLLGMIDEIIMDAHQKNYWGYSLPNYLSAKYNTHPNYAAYLSENNMLTVEAMDDVFAMMDDEKRYEFDKKYIRECYAQYMNNGTVQEEHLPELKQRLQNQEILLIAPGKSATDEKEKIIEYAGKEGVVSVGVNFDYPYYETDFDFFSNFRRFRELDVEKRGKCIITSNITAVSVYLQTKYHDLLNDQEVVKDKAGMMAIQFFVNMGVKKIVLAGYDGYSHDLQENYADIQMVSVVRNAILDAWNQGMKSALEQFKKEVIIEFLTERHYL